ncbi:hypothetical protein WJX73_000027 [Symbiochloris irregularis]|uniref:Cytochrome b561 domain-containing protein n=1 Tax=Symbiochloris irregularis TaxID=706552 RepID=A0AAW1NXD0_9CHLO
MDSIPIPQDQPALILPDSTVLNQHQFRLLVIHGWFMAAAFALFLPLGLAVAHSYKHWGRWWLWTHIVCQILAFSLSLAGIVVVTFVPIAHLGHRTLGIILQILLGLQVLFGFARPGLTHRHRRLFNVMHWWIGRLCAAIGVAEIFYGLVLSEASWGYYAGAALCIAAVASLMVGRDFVAQLRMPPPGLPQNATKQAATSPKAPIQLTAEPAIQHTMLKISGSEWSEDSESHSEV